LSYDLLVTSLLDIGYRAMNSRLFFSALLTALLTAACAFPDGSERLDLLGSPAPIAAATRTIVITPDTEHVNVIGGEIVQFVVGNHSFAWNFNGAQHVAPFDLSRTAPPGMLDHKVTAYVEPNPLYRGDGEPASSSGH
jgi:hypothetical protein